MSQPCLHIYSHANTPLGQSERAYYLSYFLKGKRVVPSKGRYTLGDKLQQHVAATDHSMWTDRATSCSNTVRRHVAATNRSVCTGESLWKSLSPQRNFVAATSRKKSNQTESVRLVAATKFCCSDKHFLQILQYTRSDLSLRRVASPCCCNLLPSVYRP